VTRKGRARLILCSGKGGTGKSTVAVAIATHFSMEGKKTLLVSSDPAHSLSGIFNRRIGGEVKKLDRNLYGIELDVEKIAEKVEKKYRKVFCDALASWLDEDIIKDLPIEMISGVDEIFALDQIRRFVDEGHDVVVWDTSPTGHTLRLLSLSKKVSDAISRQLGLYMKFAHPLQTIKTWLGRGEEPKIIRAFKELGKTTDKIAETLSDSKTEFILVLNPEKLSMVETRQLREAAEEHNIAIKRAVINKMMLPCKCKFCTLKRKEQEKNLEKIQNEHKDLKILTVPYLPYEIITKKRIREYAEKLFE
jgi:arsenite-transporting ATPase